MGRRPKWMRAAGFPILIICFILMLCFFLRIFEKHGNFGAIIGIGIATFICKLIGWGLYGYSDWFTMKSIEYEFRDAGENLTPKECLQRKIDQLVNETKQANVTNRESNKS